jgi:hypothetical protein
MIEVAVVNLIKKNSIVLPSLLGLQCMCACYVLIVYIDHKYMFGVYYFHPSHSESLNADVGPS